MNTKLLLWLVTLSGLFIGGAAVLASINPFTKLSLSDLAALADKADCKKDPRFHLAYSRQLRLADQLDQAAAEVDCAANLVTGKNAQFRLSDYLGDHDINYSIEEARAYIAEDREDYESALKHFEAAQKFNQCPSSMANKARVLDELGREEEAGKLFDQAVTKACHGEREYPLEERARFYLNHERYKDAINDLNSSLSISNCAEGSKLRALAYEGLPDLKRALSDYDDAINLKPTEFCYHKRAELRLHNKDYAGAQADLDAAAKFTPLCPQLARTREELQAAGK